jgi:hypothetical protein
VKGAAAASARLPSAIPISSAILVGGVAIRLLELVAATGKAL